MKHEQEEDIKIKKTHLRNLAKGKGEDVIIEMPCTLIHVEGQHAGFRAEKMSIDTLTSLRRLLELNLADNTEVERELNELIKTSS